MRHPFGQLQPEYAHLLSVMKVTRAQAIDAVARKLLGFVRQGRYADVSAGTSVPQAWMATSFEREASSNFKLSPAQGDRWDRVSIHVPRGIGPFPSWAAAAKAAYHIDRLDEVGAANWLIERACYEGEIFNGMGYRAHGVHSPYLWAGTNVYAGGKFVSDGQFSMSAVDQQLGIVPVMLRMIELDPSLAFVGQGVLATAASPAIVPAPAAAPVGLGGGAHDARWIQHALNRAGAQPHIDEDNSYGRETKRAVIAFQAAHGLEPDGLCGPKTFAALEQAMGGT